MSGERMRLTVNMAKCGLCGDIIESRHRHDYRSCSCGNLSVDGGLEYTRRSFKTDSWTEMSVYSDLPRATTETHTDKGKGE